MRRTAILRLLIIDRSELAKNMYQLLFRDIPGYRLEFADNAEDLSERKRRARPHLVMINSNAIQNDEIPDFIEEYPTLIIAPPDRIDLKTLARERDNITLVEKPFYPYDLITVINRVASAHNPLSGTTMPAPAPRRRRMKSVARKARG